MTERINDSFEPVPMPSVLDESTHRPQRDNLDDDAPPQEWQSAVRDLEDELERASDYGRRLWDELTRIATYLREDVARGTAGGGILASDHDWRRWQEAYASVLSTLAGPRGDNGYGATQAALERQDRTRR